MRKDRIHPDGVERTPEVEGGSPYANGILDYLKEIPSVRWEKVQDMQRRMASGDWLRVAAKPCTAISQSKGKSTLPRSNNNVFGAEGICLFPNTKL